MSRLLPLPAVLLPLAAAVYVVFAYGVNVPFWDQWELAPILAKRQAGVLTLHDLMEQHNEHRMLFPKLIMVELAEWTRWNVRAELAVNLALAFAAALVLIAAVRSTFNAAGIGVVARSAAYLVLSATVFTLAQWENWLWGWQIQWFFSLLAIVAAVFLLNAALNAWNDGRRAAGAGLLACAAGAAAAVQFSLASGVMLWPIGALVVLLHPATGKKTTLALWAALGAASCAVFFNGWHSVPIPGMPSPLETLSDPKRLIEYVLIYLSGPLRRFDYFEWAAALQLPAAAPGGAVLGVVFVAGVYLLASDWKRRAETLPWLALAAFACGAGLVTGLGRVGFGVDQGAASRYVTLSLLLTVGAIGLCAVLLARFPDRRSVGALVGALGLVAATCIVATNLASFDGVNARVGQLTAGRACLLDVAAASDDCLKANLYPDAAVVRAREPMLRAYGWSGFDAP